MPFSLKTRILVWGRSGAHCAFPGCHRDLVMEASETDDESLVGDVAHIVADSIHGPRGVSPLTQEERDRSTNLLLLCKIHHKLVDDQPKTYSVEELHEYKSTQEARIRTASSPSDLRLLRSKEVYAAFVDEWVTLAQIDNWRIWTSHMLGADGPAMSQATKASLAHAVEWGFGRIWPKVFENLEGAFDNCGRVLNDLLIRFHKHSEKHGGWYYTERFYKISDWNPERYHRLADEYDFHIDLVQDLVLESTRAANLVCDLVREHLDPSFRMKEGVLLVQSGPYSDFGFRTHRVEYRAGERSIPPYPGVNEFAGVRFTRDFCFGRPPKESKT